LQDSRLRILNAGERQLLLDKLADFSLQENAEAYRRIAELEADVKRERERREELEVVAAALYLGHDDAKEQFDMYRAVYLTPAREDADDQCTSIMPSKEFPVRCTLKARHGGSKHGGGGCEWRAFEALTTSSQDAEDRATETSGKTS